MAVSRQLMDAFNFTQEDLQARKADAASETPLPEGVRPIDLALYVGFAVLLLGGVWVITHGNALLVTLFTIIVLVVAPFLVPFVRNFGTENKPMHVVEGIAHVEVEASAGGVPTHGLLCINDQEFHLTSSEQIAALQEGAQYRVYYSGGSVFVEAIETI